MTGGKAPRAAGDRFERLVIDRLRAFDYLAIRSAGSLGPADIWAARADRGLLLISCKVHDRTTARERCEFLGTAMDAGALALIASKTGRGRIQFVRIHGPSGLRDPYDIGNAHG